MDVQHDENIQLEKGTKDSVVRNKNRCEQSAIIIHEQHNRDWKLKSERSDRMSEVSERE